MWPTIIIVLLISTPFMIWALTEKFEAFMLAGMVSFLIFIGILGETEKMVGWETINPGSYIVETTPTRHFIHIKSEDGRVRKSLIIDTVAQYNLVNSGNYMVRLAKKKNFFWDFDSTYEVSEKVAGKP